LFSLSKVKKTQQQISPSINVLLFKLISVVIIVELDQNKNFESATIGF